VACGQFLEAVIQVNDIFSPCQVQCWKKFEQLEKNMVNLGAISISNWMPGCHDPAVGGDDVVEARDDVITQYHIVAAYLQEARVQGHHAILFAVILRGRKVFDVKAAGPLGAIFVLSW
jgi:hypothetical protein